MGGRLILLSGLFVIFAIEEVFSSFRILGALRCKLPDCAPPPRGCRSFITNDDKGCPAACNYACGSPWCGPRSCSEPCYGGYKRNEMGCVTCECKPVCKTQLCRNPCPFGREKDERGCVTCKCKRKPLPCHQWMKCPQGPCPDSCRCKPDCYTGPAPDTPAGAATKSESSSNRN